MNIGKSSSSNPQLEITKEFFDCLSQLCIIRKFTLHQVMENLQKNFEDTHLWDEIFNQMLLDTNTQQVAEIALTEIASSMDIRRQYRIRDWREKPGRDIDWSQTRMRTLTGDVGKYCNITRAEQTDRQLTGGLATIARQWSGALKTYRPTNADERIKQLEKAIRIFSNDSNIAWSKLLERKLYQKNPAGAQPIVNAIALWNRKDYQAQELAQTLKDLSMQDQARSGGKWLKNADNLFEWIITHRIAIAAHQQGWEWDQHKHDADILNYEDKDHNDWRLAIYKGRLRQRGAGKIENSIGDAIKNAYEDAGLVSNGLMPDIVLEFFRESLDLKSCYFIADAKRNAEDYKLNYVKASIGKAAIYLHAFQNTLNNNPKCTLFFWQGINKVFGESFNNGNVKLIDFSQAKADGKVWRGTEILCLDLRWIKPESEASRHEGILAKWLEHLFNQAKEDLSISKFVPH
ncbi:MAG: hypothetical protein JSS06_06385 [Proteobacteria bacterium]|nr:hypothetical protein [Pseudomonadota bacterium]